MGHQLSHELSHKWFVYESSNVVYQSWTKSRIFILYMSHELLHMDHQLSHELSQKWFVYESSNVVYQSWTKSRIFVLYMSHELLYRDHQLSHELSHAWFEYKSSTVVNQSWTESRMCCIWIMNSCTWVTNDVYMRYKLLYMSHELSHEFSLYMRHEVHESPTNVFLWNILVLGLGFMV